MLKPFVKTNIKVVNMKNHKKTEYDYYIGRPSPLGNPYTHLKDSKNSKFFVETRDDAIEMYEAYLYTKIENNDNDIINALNEIFDIYNKYGKVNFVCYCKPKCCHGDYVKKYIDKCLSDTMYSDNTNP